MKINVKTTGKTISHVVILGGGYAGVLAALRLAGKTKRSPVTITLVNGSDAFTERIRLHQLATNQTLPTISLPGLLKGTDVQFVQGWATQIDADAQTVTVQRTDGEFELPYDKLVYALGSSVDLESVEGVAQNTTALASTSMVQQMRQSISELAQKSGRILVVGGGLTGIEAATEIAESYPQLNVTLVTRGKLGEQLAEKGRQHVRHVFQKLGIQTQEAVTVVKVDSDQLLDADGNIQSFDLCIWSAGFSVSQLAAHAHIACDEKGRVLVDDELRSLSHPNIYAVGDSAHTVLRMACATAMPMGAYAADHLAATIKGRQPQRPFEFGYVLHCISLGRKDALIQCVDAYDVPQARVFRGRSAVIIKELICRYTVWSLKLEKWLPGLHQWPKTALNMSSSEAKPSQARTNSVDQTKLSRATQA